MERYAAAMTELDDRVAAEIAALHVVFEDWLRGTGDSLDRVEASLGEGFAIVPPRGALVARADLMAGLQQARGSRDVRIRVKRPQVLWQHGDALLAAYEEWHEHGEYTTTRQSTALFTLDETAPGGLRWQHVHETWITPPPGWVVPAAASDSAV